MRVGGLATGMDIEAMVDKLMQAERIPLDKMHQERTTLTWKRDSFREINRALLELETLARDMKYSKNYNAKTAKSTQEGAVTAIAKGNAQLGVTDINVDSLATKAMLVSTDKVTIDPNMRLGDLDESSGIHFGEEFIFKTFDVEKGEMVEHKFEVSEDDTLNDVLKRISDADNNVKAFYDVQSQQVVLESTRTGSYNENGNEIVFDSETNAFFTQTLNLTGEEIGGENAKFTYNNGLTIETQNNWYELNGVIYEFQNTTNGNARITIDNDIDHTFDKIVELVDKYNEVIDKLNATQQEKVYRDFPPLTEEQKAEMTDDQIEKWEEKAKSGILRRESAITDGMTAMRQGWYSNVDTGGAFTSLTQIGITTSERYLDGGKLEIDEDKLKEALRENPEDVQKLFTNPSDGASRGLVNRLEDSVKTTMNRIEERAGKDYHTLDNYTLGRQMDYLNKRISDFESRMVRVENRYWNQFTQMEKAIQRLNDQSAQLFSQFGGGM